MNPTTLQYLVELRHRLLKSACFAVLLFIPLFFYANKIFLFLAKPLTQYLHGPMVAINVTAPIMVPIELAAKLACLLTLPYLIYQIWSYITPALYSHEGKLLRQLYATSMVLLICGLLFCYFIALPLLFGFFTSSTDPQIQLLPDISYYMSLTSHFFLLFACTFQIPVILYFLIRTNIFTIEQLQSARSYIIVIAFTLGMLLTPPDVLSQILLAVPICLLYELGLLMAKKLPQKPIE